MRAWYSLVQASVSGASRFSPTFICWRSLAPSMTITAAGFSASSSALISFGQSWKSSAQSRPTGYRRSITRIFGSALATQ